jgi:hypothetical protein
MGQLGLNEHRSLLILEKNAIIQDSPLNYWLFLGLALVFNSQNAFLLK